MRVAAARARPARARRARPRPRGSRRSTASARGSCARTRSPRGWTRRSRCSTSRRRARAAPRGLRRRARRLPRRRATARAADALDLAAGYTPDRLRRMVGAAHDELRSARADAARAAADRRGRPRGRARRARGRRAAAPPPRCAAREAGVTIERARVAIAACRATLDTLPAAEPATAAALKAAAFGAGSVAELQEPPAARYLDALAAFAAACRDARARPVLALLDELLRALRRRLRRGQARARRASTSTTSSCSRATCSPARPARGRELRRALRADHGRRVPGHEPAAARDPRASSTATTSSPSATSCSRSTASATPTSSVFRARRARLAAHGRDRDARDQLPRAARDPRDASTPRSATRTATRWVALRPGRDDAGRRPSRASSCWSPTPPLGGHARRRSSPTACRRGTGGPPRRGAARRPARRRARPRRRGGRRRHRRAAARRDRHRPVRARARAGRASRRSRPAGAAGGGASRSGPLPPTSPRSPTRATRRRCSACSPRRSSALSSDALALLGDGRARAPRRALGRRSTTPRRASRPPTHERLRRLPRLVRAPSASGRRGLGLDELLDRVVERTGYDLHVLALPGGARRLANIHKLLRLAAAFEARRGRDVRGFIDLATAELEAEAREPDAPVDLGDLEAVRLMTIHAAKGLEFPVVIVADLGRRGATRQPDLLVERRPRRPAARRAWTTRGRRRSRGRRSRTPAAPPRRPRSAASMHVAMTRAEERLILSGRRRAWTKAGRRPGPARRRCPGWGRRSLPDLGVAVARRRPRPCASGPPTAIPAACARR